MEGHANLAGVAVGRDQPVRLMGVINVSPESFYAGSVQTDAEALVAEAERMVADGAEAIDIGAKSTAPYRKTAISEGEERRRMVWAIETLASRVAVPLSADTQRSSVAAAAIAAGARIVNDVSGLRADERMADVAAQAEGLVLMAMEEGPSSADPITECFDLLRRALNRAATAGIPAERIVLDPGIGFFRQGSLPWLQFDLAVLRGLGAFRDLGRPLLVGVSRKSFLGKLTGRDDPAARLAASLAATAVAVVNGADIVRTHDVAATRDAVRVAERLRAS